MHDVTVLLSALEQGNPGAAEELLPLVYDELRKLAAARLTQEPSGQTLQATALVHEAYLRLVGKNVKNGWSGRAHFFGAAAEAMRRILVENARRKQGEKRGAGFRRCEDHLDQIVKSEPDAQLLAIHEVLEEFAVTDPEAAQLVKLRYFAGMTTPEAAAALGLSLRSSERLWAYAKAWLYRRLRSDQI